MVLNLIWWFVFALLWLFFIPIIAVWRRATRFWLAVLGLWLTTGSFFLLPWIEFAPWRYAQSLTLNLVSEAILAILEWGDVLEKLPEALGFISKFLSPSGLFVVIFLPSLNVTVRLTLIAVVLAGGVGLAGILIGWLSRSSEVQCLTGLGQGLFALLTLILLVANLNALDGWATVGKFPHSLLPVLTGAEIGLGPWMACLGLIILIVAGVWAVADANTGMREPEYQHYWGTL